MNNNNNTDGTGAKDGPLARITPEADEQTDGKGRTLPTIDKGLDAEVERIWAEVAKLRGAMVEGIGHANARITRAKIDIDTLNSKIDMLIAGSVPKPCEPSKATGQNELATDIMCDDRQRFLASVCESCRAVVLAMLAKGDIPGVCKTGN